MGIKKNKLMATENRFVIASGKLWRMGEMGEESQRVQTSIYKIKELWECNVQHGVLVLHILKFPSKYILKVLISGRRKKKKLLQLVTINVHQPYLR